MIERSRVNLYANRAFIARAAVCRARNVPRNDLNDVYTPCARSERLRYLISNIRKTQHFRTSRKFNNSTFFFLYNNSFVSNVTFMILYVLYALQKLSFLFRNIEISNPAVASMIIIIIIKRVQKIKKKNLIIQLNVCTILFYVVIFITCRVV